MNKAFVLCKKIKLLILIIFFKDKWFKPKVRNLEKIIINFIRNKLR
jgi:hypothetical protein